jgi:hypothetical protein
MSDKREKILLLTGSGALENAWGSIVFTFQKYYGIEIDSARANYIFSQLVYMARLYSNDEDKTFYNNHLKILTDIKNEISKGLNFHIEAGLLKVRPSFYSILEKFIFLDNVEPHFITTNWDNAIKNALAKFKAENDIQLKNENLYIHGNIDELGGIYLPSEMVSEPYRQALDAKILWHKHLMMRRTINKCHCIILYGLSLDPLDAELSQFILVGLNNNILKKIIIIDPNHHIVANRVGALLANRDFNIQLIGYNPDNLDKAKFHSLKELNKIE